MALTSGVNGNDGRNPDYYDVAFIQSNLALIIAAD